MFDLRVPFCTAFVRAAKAQNITALLAAKISNLVPHPGALGANVQIVDYLSQIQGDVGSQQEGAIRAHTSSEAAQPGDVLGIEGAPQPGSSGGLHTGAAEEFRSTLAQDNDAEEGRSDLHPTENGAGATQGVETTMEEVNNLHTASWSARDEEERMATSWDFVRSSSEWRIAANEDYYSPPSFSLSDG